ncbi:MAG TPA: hypothetical protein VGK00_04260 [Anaerolineales bacterium]|jgi:hypothetical protein
MKGKFIFDFELSQDGKYAGEILIFLVIGFVPGGIIGTKRIFVLQNIYFVTGFYDACHYQTGQECLKLGM